MAGVHSHLDVFDDRNAFLQVTLGLVSACHRLLEAAVHAGPAAEPPTVRDDDPVLYAALGVASLSSDVMRQMQTVVTADAEGARTSTEPTAASDPQDGVDLRSFLV